MIRLAISKSGINVLTATNPNDFIFHSLYNTLKIIAEGTLLNQIVDAHPKTFTVAHGQSIIPIVFAFVKFPDGKIGLPVAYAYNNSSQMLHTVRVSATNISFEFYRTGANYTVDIKYYVFEAPL
jgi:hypothetical protein